MFATETFIYGLSRVEMLNARSNFDGGMKSPCFFLILRNKDMARREEYMPELALVSEAF